MEEGTPTTTGNSFDSDLNSKLRHRPSLIQAWRPWHALYGVRVHRDIEEDDVVRTCQYVT